MVTFFLVLGWVIALFSLLGVSQATTGVAGICFACFMAISARIAQATRQHAQLLERLAVRAAPVPQITAKPEAVVTEQNVAELAKQYGVTPQ